MLFRSGHVLFEELSRLIREEVVLTLFHVELAPEDAAELRPVDAPSHLEYAHDTFSGADAILSAGGAAATAIADQPVQRQIMNDHRDVGRNEACWCGSGKKFKRCHGA